ncbi:MAG: hypothetical protein H6974_12325 [Gammaproteobacteria bacterium]|nr:hypothetical protein [Gammaproteobacteria bacterium]
MTILASDLKILRTENELGGSPTASEVQDNVNNNCFQPIASGDRVTGKTETATFAAAVQSPDTAELLSARLYIGSQPTDPAVSVALFAVPDDTANAETILQDSLYQGVQRGANTNFRLLTNYGPGTERVGLYYAHSPNQTAIANPPETSQLVLVDTTAGSEEVVSVTPDGYLTNDDYAVYYYKLSKPLTQTFGGALFFDAGTKDDVTDTQIYLVDPQTIPVYGIASLAAQADADDTHIVVSTTEVALGPIVGLERATAKNPEGNADVEVPYQFVQTASAAASRAQTLSVSGSYTVLRKVTYRYQGAWISESFALTGSGYFVLLLEHIPDAGSTLIYYASNPSAFYQSGTTLVFLMPENLVAGSVALTAISDAETILTAADNGVGGMTGDISAAVIDYTTGLVTVTLDASCPVSAVILDARFTALADDLGEVGIDLEKLPPSKTAPLFRVGDTLVVQHTQHETLANPLVADTTYPLARSAVDAIWLEAANGTRIPTAQYTVNLSAGSIHTIVGLDLSGYAQPVEAYTSLLDEAVIVGISGTTLTLNQALAHTYPSPGSTASSVLRLGDRSALVSDPFAQSAWTSVWSDTPIPPPITPQFDHTTYPLVVTNESAITERWRIQFTGTTTVNIIGERVGQIATGLSVTADIAPINPATGQPYFVIPYQGWGAGWVNGNLLRFDTTGAYKLFGAVRCVQPSEHVPGATDRFRLAFVGDVGA